MEKFIPYIGLEYKPSARGKEVMDCWGLVVHIYKDLYNIDLPEYDTCSMVKDGAKGTVKFIFGTDLYKKCQKISTNEDINEGDIILLTNLGYATHIGVAIDNENMIHCFDRAGSVIESYRSPKWINRIAGIYRHPSFI